MPDPSQREFVVSKRGNLTKKLEGGPQELTPKMETMIRLMVWGLAGDEEQRPLSITEAARKVGYRLKAARALASAPVFVRAYDRACDELRKSERARSLRTIIEIRDDVGAGKAADRKVRMDAAQLLMDDQGGRGSGVTVNVNTQVITPGYVIDLRPEHDPRVIAGEAALNPPSSKKV